MNHIPDDFKMCSDRVRTLWRSLQECRLCPRNCGVNRLAGQLGYCQTGPLPVISSYGAHFGEEEVLVGVCGSGTVFFSGCNLRCVFCQNYEISHLHRGQEKPVSELVRIFLELQDEGCHNINLVTPTHQIAAIAVAFELARKQGLSVPIVYNTGGYDSLHTLRQIEGLVDIYMPDMKYADPAMAELYSDAGDYPDVNTQAVKEMQRQVGDLHVVEGVAQKGLLVRHLVMPDGIAGGVSTINFIKAQISLRTAINIMDQYCPCGDANIPEHPLAKKPKKYEIDYLITYAREKGLRIIE